MNLAHVHLLLNHFPTIGFGIGLGLAVAALFHRGDDLRRASLVVLFVIALIAIPAYLSGSAAHFVLRTRGSDAAEDMIAAHQDAAMLALILMQITGAAAWVALWRFRRWHLPVVVGLSIVAFGLMARAANIGGEIQHLEIRAAGTAAPVTSWPAAAAIGAAWVIDNPWAWPISEIFHFVGLCLLFGVVLVVNLQMLGFIRGVALGDVKRLLPWGMAGLGLNIVTGMLFFLASPDQYTQNAAFAVKMGLVLIGGVTLLYPTMLEGAATPGGGSPIGAKIVAAGSIFVWIGVIFFGRFLPYLGSE